MRLMIVLLLILSISLIFGGIDSRPVIAEEPGYGGDILYTKPIKAVMFSHKSHVEDFGMSCNLCHDKLFQMEALNAQKNEDFNHKTFQKRKYCGACHDGKMGFAMNAQCTRCHMGVKGYNRAMKTEKGKAATTK